MPDQLLREPPRVRETIAQVWGNRCRAAAGCGAALFGFLGCRAPVHQARNEAFVDTAETDGEL